MSSVFAHVSDFDRLPEFFGFVGLFGFIDDAEPHLSPFSVLMQKQVANVNIRVGVQDWRARNFLVGLCLEIPCPELLIAMLRISSDAA